MNKNQKRRDQRRNAKNKLLRKAFRQLIPFRERKRAVCLQEVAKVSYTSPASIPLIAAELLLMLAREGLEG